MGCTELLLKPVYAHLLEEKKTTETLVEAFHKKAPHVEGLLSN
jgi:hypothetical protein